MGSGEEEEEKDEEFEEGEEVKHVIRAAIPDNFLAADPILIRSNEKGLVDL